MKHGRTIRGFEEVTHPRYAPQPEEELEPRLVAESSAIGDYADSWDRPGTSFLWVGEAHHLNREEVAELVERLENWLDHGSLKTDAEQEV